jgi:regulator of sigma E protease
MTFILFVLILLVLIFVHELGHFLAAKSSKIKVHEFALGFSPKIWKKKKGETEYSLGVVPFGGYVRIHGENPEDVGENDPDKDRALNHKPWYIQAWVLVAGVVFNIIFAWLLISFSFMSGYPTVVDEGNNLRVEDPQVVIVAVQEDSPADEAGIKTGDVLVSIEDGHNLQEAESVEDIRNFIAESSSQATLHLKVKRSGEELFIPVKAKEGIIEGRPAIGISMNIVGVVKYGFFDAFIKGAETTYRVTVETAKGLGKLIKDAVTGKAELSSVTGPVGIAGMVGDARQFGFVYLLGFTALISINLAVINMIPFPALDGGRLLIVIIEAISRKKVPMKLQGWINGIGFLLLMILMVLVTIGDVGKLLK